MYADILTKKSSTSTSGVPEFFSKLFEIRDTIHLTHLYQVDRTLATHLALDELYNGILDLADGLVETYQGIHGLVSFTIPQTKVQVPLDYVKASYDWIASNRYIIQESFLQNQIDEIQQVLAKALYKLQFVK